MNHLVNQSAAACRSLFQALDPHAFSLPRPSRLCHTLIQIVAGIALASSFSAHASGVIALQHDRQLSEVIGHRIAGSKEERDASNYIETVLKNNAYSVARQTVRWTRNDVGTQRPTGYRTDNLIAEKKGLSTKVIVVGAHYDSMPMGVGADDNASSVSVLLEVAQAIRDMQMPYTVRFVFFTAEEQGEFGSMGYVSNLLAPERANIIGMINLDSLIAGDKRYVHAGTTGKNWLRDQILAVSKRLGAQFTTNPGLNPRYPYGTTGDWSDHAAFDSVGIPIAALESTNWEIGDLDGYTQTALWGSFWHTPNDNLTTITKRFPGRIEAHFDAYTNVLIQTLLELSPH